MHKKFGTSPTVFFLIAAFVANAQSCRTCSRLWVILVSPVKFLLAIGKLFAGIAGVRIVTSDITEGVKTRFDAMVSKDSEIVEFDRPIDDITIETPVKVWLNKLEQRMQLTLATLLLQEAVSTDSFTTNDQRDEGTQAAFVAWAAKCPALQVMILAAQINCSASVVDKALSITR